MADHLLQINTGAQLIPGLHKHDLTKHTSEIRWIFFFFFNPDGFTLKITRADQVKTEVLKQN